MESTWTVEMILHYCAALDEAARGDKFRLPELINPEHTAKLLAGVRALAWRPAAAAPVAPVKITLWGRVAEVLRKRGRLDTRGLAVELSHDPIDLSGRMQVFKRRGWVAVVGVTGDGGKKNNVWRLDGEHAKGGEGAEADAGQA